MGHTVPKLAWAATVATTAPTSRGARGSALMCLGQSDKDWSQSNLAHSMWSSIRFMTSRLAPAVCTKMLSFMKYTIPGADPRAPLPVP